LTTATYDGFGRRVSRTVDNQAGGSGSQTRLYAYVGLEPIAYTDTWNSHHVNLYRDDQGRILAQDRYTGGDNGQQLWLTQDGVRSTLSIANDQGQAAKSYRYDPFGLPDVREFDSDTHSAYLYTGQEYDESTGLYHYQARDYDPFTATWLTRDPYRGAPNDPQSLHRYGYVKGDPINLRDVLGYAAQSGTHGKEQNTDPFIEFLFGAQFQTSYEFTFNLKELFKKALGGVKVPDKITKFLKELTPLDFELVFGYSSSKQLRFSALLLKMEQCRSIEVYGRLGVEATWPIVEGGLFSVEVGIGGSVSLKGGVEACVGVDVDVLKPDLKSFLSASASITFSSEKKAFLRGTGDIFIASAELETGVRSTQDQTLAQCNVEAGYGIRQGFSFESDCGFQSDISFGIDVYAGAKWSVGFMSKSEEFSRKLFGLKFNISPFTKRLFG
jgi:RHS repeat-associated protein